MKDKIIIIAGPTASGKTAISLELAKELNGEIISADSMQIYKRLDINTAKATKEEKSVAPHHLIDVINPDEEFSVTDYVEHADKCIQDTISRGKTPIIVGGTGMYIKSLLFSQSFGGTAKDDNVREKYRKYLKENGVTALHNLLKDFDPESANIIHPNNTKRVIRALEIYDITGSPKSSQKDTFEPRYDYKLFVLDVPRDTLYTRINKRVDIMLSTGGVDEAKLVYNMHLPPDSQCLGAIGYKEIFPYIEGTKSLQEVANDLATATRHYAKRQLTYFRSFEDAIWLNPFTQKDKIIEIAKEFLC